MKVEASARLSLEQELDRARAQYHHVDRPAYSLQRLFDRPGITLSDFCRDFHPHPQSEVLRKWGRDFGEQYGIWLPNAQHHVTCALYLYPEATTDRMVTMMKNLIVDFYLNDLYGRDQFGQCSPDEQYRGKQLIDHIATMGEALAPQLPTNPVEVANAATLEEFKKGSPAHWFAAFLRLYCHHIGVTYKDNNTATTGRLLSIDNYIERRCHFAGMHHIVMWVEYCDGQFLDWHRLSQLGLSDKMRDLHWTIAAFGALSNDLFSFEKEVIDNGSDSNLVMITLLNHPGLPLDEALLAAARIVSDLLARLFSLLQSIQAEIVQSSFPDPTMRDLLVRHLRGLERCMQASWLWQVFTQRYKRPNSIWEETNLERV
ncbi:terpene synthase family protein [Dinghuibacter silviterrae]|uniref:Terpene synthase n=1 Tax=Dinghuibacter silviterrae TaxID=1539049 RepID=A0A4R8DHV7_9BACT|nr:terpene synthase family protein [Dinghuibacter silviterrae]TDW97125.1 hypothetical protein EDB95_4966 [Dinghuibacter silviterrae]